MEYFFEKPMEKDKLMEFNQIVQETSMDYAQGDDYEELD